MVVITILLNFQIENGVERGIYRWGRCGMGVQIEMRVEMTEIFAFFVGPSILFGFIYLQLFTSGQGGVGPGQ